MKRRSALAIAAAATLPGLLLDGCGFKLRGEQHYAFARLAIVPNPGGPFTQELRRSVGQAVHVLNASDPVTSAQAVLEVLQELREKVVVAVNSSGQVREFQLRIRVKFRLATPAGQELMPLAELVQQRDISFNESAVLAKETEEGLLYRDMQTDLVQQILRRLATIKPGFLS
jgi:LPS-assembly lipoprotein